MAATAWTAANRVGGGIPVEDMDMTVLGDRVRLNGHSGFITGERDGR